MKTAINKLIGTKNFYREVLVIFIPITIQQLITTGVQLIDNVMVGRLGEEALSAVATVNQITFILMLALFGLMGGVGIYLSQLYGANDIKRLKETFQFRLVASLLLMIVGITFIYLYLKPLIMLFIDDAKTIELSIDYANVALISFFPLAISNAIQMTFRETLKPHIPMVNGIIAIVTNTILNYLLIFGKFGLPELGVTGAAIATVIARIVELLFAIYYMIRYGEVFKLKGLEYFKPNLAIYKIVLKKALPLMFNEIVWSTGRTILFFAYSTRGLDAIAGINITTTVTNLAFVAIQGVSNAISVMVGMRLGANKLEEAKDTANKLMFLSFMIGLLVGLGLIAIRGSILSLYDITNSTKDIAQASIVIYALIMPFMGINNAGYFTLRSGGALIETIIIDAGFTAVILIPFALILAFYTNLDIVSLYLACTFMEVVKIIPTLYIYRKGTWIRNLT